MFPWVKSQKWERPMYTSIGCGVPWVKSQKWEEAHVHIHPRSLLQPYLLQPPTPCTGTNTPQHIGLQIGLQPAPCIFFSTSTFYYALYLVFLQSSTTYISAPYIIQPIFSISSLSLFFCVTRECQHLIFRIPRVVFCQVSKSFIALVLIRTNVLFLIVYRRIHCKKKSNTKSTE